MINLKEKIIWVFPIIAFLLGWELISRIGMFPTYLFPPFSTVLLTLYFLTIEGILLNNLASSLFRVIIGFTFGACSGILVGILMGVNSKLDQAFSPIFSLLMPIPALGWVPLFMLWIGINELLPIALVFMCSFFPVLYNTITGIRSVETEYLEASRTLGASKMQVLTTILLPLSFQNIITGLRLEAGMAWRVIIAAEMVAIPSGIGALMMRAESLLRVDVILVCLIVLSIMCLISENIFVKLEERTKYWK
ncbi:MAG: ABC transporter permease [Candidatus Bathyarchaeota archaeon]|nr:ABC transporter permease [Candidatus Bathyarchaeota archaeon]